ncbi:MAG: hypothetical protein KatS3mg111_3367 [Pirellulaceae bacterium]|nr:MAG: hypothetical protein KatS3mg111_3367 [Pirellulaceae bacterium]
MSLLGRVFIAIVFVLSIIFFTVSVMVNATHINWKEQADTFKQRADDATRKNGELTELLEEVKTELAIEQAARVSALAALQTQLDEAKAELSSKEAELIALQAAHTNLVQREAETQRELNNRTEENELLRQQLVDARANRDQLFQRLVAAKDEYNRLQGAYQSLREREQQLAADYTMAKEKLDILGIKPETQLEAPPPVNGTVLAVASDGLVEISLGRDDGIREGFTLEVHRDGQYLGRVKVRSVRDDKSVAEILTSYQRGYIRPGDRVDARLF